MSNLSFYISLASLLIILVYIVLVFKNVEPIVATAICVVLGFAYNHLSPIEMGKYMADALSSFLAMVGFIIMLGRGLGEVLSETKASHTIVYKIAYSIGINTKSRVKAGVILSSITVVALLGTLAGGLAILAPILRPIASKVGINRPCLAALMQASGEEALILGPFTPPMITLLGVTALNYQTVLFRISIPISLVTLITSLFMANHLQKKYPEELFDNEDTESVFIPTRRNKITTLIFLTSFILAVIYGISTHAKTSYVIIVMLFLALITGLAGELSLKRIFELLINGMQKNLHLFFIFILLDPFLNLVQAAGGFDSLSKIFIPLEHLGGKPLLAILIALTGAFGMPAASEAVIKMLHQMFNGTAIEMGLPVTTFAFSILIATRITNFAYPGANMFAAMGFAESKNIKAMIKNGLAVTLVQVSFLVLYSIMFI